MSRFNKATAAVLGGAIATAIVAFFPGPFAADGVAIAFEAVVVGLFVFFAPTNATP